MVTDKVPSRPHMFQVPTKMLMNKVSPATLCSSQEVRRSELDSHIGSSGSDHCSQFSQFSQTSFDLFPSQPTSSVPHQKSYGKDNSRFRLSQCMSEEKQAPADYYQRYLSAQSNRSSSGSSQGSGQARPTMSSSWPQSNTTTNTDTSLNKSRYQQWKAETSQKSENKAVIDAIVKVTRECAQELGETLHNLKLSITAEDNLDTAHELKQENSQLLDHQKSRLADISDSQLEMRTLLKEMIHKIDKKELQFVQLESKIDLLAKSTDKKFHSLENLIEKAVEKIENLSEVCQKSLVQAHPQQIPEYRNSPAALKSASIPSDSVDRKTTSQQNTTLTSLGEKNVLLDCHSVSPSSQFIAVNSSYSSQSGVDIDLSQMSPSVCGEIISQCLSGGNGNRTRLARSDKLMNLSNSSIPLPNKQGRKTVKKHNLRAAPIITRAKRLRSNSVSSDDEEHCRVTVTMKTMDVKRSVRRSKKPISPMNEPGRFRQNSQACYGNENAFLCSPVYSASNKNCQTVRCRKEEQQKRLRINKSVLKGAGGDILKELQTAMLPK